MLSTFYLSLATALFASGVAAEHASRASSQSPFVPVRRDISLHFDTDGRYIISVIMGTQLLNLTMTTSTGVTYVAGADCSDCNGTLYNRNASSTAQPLPDVGHVDFLGSPVGVSVIKENCSLPTNDGTVWVYANQTLAVISQSPASSLNQISGTNIGEGVSGLVGLGTNRNLQPSSSTLLYDPTFDDSIFGQFLSINPTADNFTFGVYLLPPRRLAVTSSSGSSALPADPDSSIAGIVNWLQPDDSAYDPASLSWATVNNGLPLNAATDPQDWIIKLDGWVFLAGNNTVSNRAQMTGNIDPMYHRIYIPLDQATLIHATTPGSVPQPQVSTLDTLAQSWSIPCSSQFTLDIIVGSRTYRLDETALVLDNGDGSCTSAIEAWMDVNVDQYLLGARFMSTVYMIFNVGRDGTSAVGFAQRVVEAHHIDTGAIIGGSVGAGCLLLVLISASCFYVYRHRARRLNKVQQEDNMMYINPNIVAYPIVTPFPPTDSPLQRPSPLFHPSPLPSPSPLTHASPLAHPFAEQPLQMSNQNHSSSDVQSVTSAPSSSHFFDVPDNPPFFRIVSRNNLRHSPSQATSSFNSPYNPTSMTGSEVSLTHNQFTPFQSTRSPDHSPCISPRSLGKEKEKEVGPPAYSPVGRMGLRLATVSGSDEDLQVAEKWLPEKDSKGSRS